MKGELVEYQIPAQEASAIAKTTPATLLEIAVSNNADIDKLEKLMALQERWEQNQARNAYHEAMAAFKADPPEIVKNKKVSYNNTSYCHATLAAVTTSISAALSKHGLSAAWKIDQSSESAIGVTCTITHRLGHSESTSLSAGADTSGSKNKIQAVGSTITYLQRYTILALTGLAAVDQDDDGGKSEAISDDQLNTLTALIDDNFGDDAADYVPRLLKYLKIDALADLPESRYSTAENAIKIAISKRAEK